MLAYCFTVLCYVVAIPVAMESSLVPGFERVFENSALPPISFGNAVRITPKRPASPLDISYLRKLIEIHHESKLVAAGSVPMVRSPANLGNSPLGESFVASKDIPRVEALKNELVATPEIRFNAPLVRVKSTEISPLSHL